LPRVPKEEQTRSHFSKEDP
jgi:hypothetical protein